MNSMSYNWLGDNVKPHELLKPYYKEFPGLHFVLLYKDPIFSFVEVEDDGTFHINGMTSEYLTYKPTDIGINNMWNGRSIRPAISTKTYNIKHK